MNTKSEQSIFKHFWWLFLLSLIIIASVIIYFCCWPGQDKTNVNKNLNDQESTEQNINSSSNIDTSDWLTYRNEVAKFELKYPPANWEISVVQGQNPNTTLAPTFRYCGYQKGGSSLGFYAYKGEVEAGTTLESQFVVLDLDKILEQKFITLGHEQAMQTKFIRQRSATPEEFIDVIHNRRVYRLFLGAEPAEPCQNDPERAMTYREIQETILSTFKFID